MSYTALITLFGRTAGQTFVSLEAAVNYQQMMEYGIGIPCWIVQRH